jgi:hypothetical protein
MRYLIPCECGRQIPISTSRAGESLTCECGRSFTAPKLRELRQLPAASDDQPGPSRRAWSRQQGVLFAVGLALLMVSAVVLTVTTLQRTQLHTEPPEIPPEPLDEFLAQIDRNTPLQNFEIWQTEILEEGLDRAGDPHYVIERRIASALDWIRLAGGVGAVLGLGMIVAAFVMRPATPSRQPGKATV